jgi:seryl-tRNA synthetase
VTNETHLKIVACQKSIEDSKANIEKLQAQKKKEYQSVQEFGKGDFTETNRVMKVMNGLHEQIKAEENSIRAKQKEIKKLDGPTEAEEQRREDIQKFHGR